jgi:hypothetical protein
MHLGGGSRLHLKAEDLYEPPGGILELTRCMDKVNDLTTKINARGVGEARAIKLGLQGLPNQSAANQKIWLEGLKNAKPNEVRSVTAEWADADSVAAHYGFGIQLFCTEDMGRGSGPSVLNADNRRWLKEAFGIEFVTVDQLALKVSQ